MKKNLVHTAVTVGIRIWIRNFQNSANGSANRNQSGIRREDIQQVIVCDIGNLRSLLVFVQLNETQPRPFYLSIEVFAFVHHLNVCSEKSTQLFQSLGRKYCPASESLYIVFGSLFNQSDALEDIRHIVNSSLFHS